MNDIVLNYIVQAVLGGASGYITNDYAINMLFKEYTPLKIGGVIKKTREEFIDNLSSMVENDIINKEKLHEILCDENFKNQFEKLTADFYNNCIIEATGNVTWAKLITEDTDKFIHKLINEHFADIYELIIKNINLEELLSENQLNAISSFFYNAILEMLESNEEIIENLLLSIYNNNLNLTLNKIIDNELSHHVVSNIVTTMNDKIIKSNDIEIKNIIHLLGIDKAFIESANILLNKKLADVINLDDEFIDKTNDKVLSYINSDVGNGFIYNLCASLFTYGKNINKSIFELLNDKFEEKLKNYFIESIPSLTEKIVHWIKENNDEIDKLLEEAIDEVIKESDGLKAMLLSTIKNTYLSSLSKKYSIIDRIVAYVESVSEPDKLSTLISAKTIEILSNISVSELIDEAENNGLTPHKCKELIIVYLNNNLTNILYQTIQYINEIKINKYLSSPSNVEAISSVLISFKKLFTWQKTQNFFEKKFSSYVNNLLTKELGNLINEEKIKELSLDFNRYIKKLLKNNKTVVESWISNQIYNTVENSSFNISNSSISYLNEELYKLYENYSEKLKKFELSLAIEKLRDIENIAKNSSDSLRSYAIKNTDSILKGSVKLIATDNLNKLNDDELANLANDFIGRELKPIMFFGGLLGVIAGLILAAFQNKALNLQEISIANMALYAFVGFMTNVIAISMIFKPYKENKLISNIPFLKNFSVGYIVKNQKIFAEKTSYFIDNSLLNKASISELFEKHEENIKNSFIKTASDNDYKLLKSLLSNNKLTIVNKVFSFIKIKTEAGVSHLCSFLYSKLKKITLSSIPHKSVELFKNNIFKLINSKNINSSIYNTLSSNNSTKIDFINNYIANFIENINKNNINKNISKFHDKYKSIENKRVNEILNENEVKSIQEFISSKTSSILLTQENRDKIFYTVSSLFKKSFDKNKKIGEIFDGKLKNYVDSHLPILTENITKLLNKNIQSNKAKITIMIQREIRNNLGFIEKSMYSLMGGDEIVDELIKKVVNVKVPLFLELKKNEVNRIISTTINEKIYKENSEVLYSILNKLQLKQIIDHYVFENSEKIENKLQTATNNIVNNLENIEINKLLNLLYLNKSENILEKYKSELEIFVDVLSENTENNKNEIILCFNDFSQISYKDIFKEIVLEDVDKVLNNSINLFNKNNAIEEFINMFFDNFIKNNKNINIGSIISETEFIESLEKYIDTLIASSEFEKTAKKIFVSSIDDAVVQNLNFISDDAKDYLFNTFIDASINSLKRNLDEILRTVEFDKFAKEEIEKMEPRKIHEMFNSFGEKYFRRLMIYGFGGFVFGINVYIGLTLAALKVTSQFLKQDK